MQSELNLSWQELLLDAREKGYLSGKLTWDASLSRYTTWRIGGNAECIYQAESIKDLQSFFIILEQNVAINWIGLGSNLLIRDGGLKGVVICTNGVLNEFSCECDDLNNHCLVSAQAGLSSAVFSRKVAGEGLNGAEFLSGIPGTIGGALAMNAGAFGSEIWDYVKKVMMITRQGKLNIRTADDFKITYRKVELKNQSLSSLNSEWFIQGEFLFNKDKAGLNKSKLEIKQLLAKRAATQPTKQANAGSVFKNPKNDYAARLIESCGLKGFSINDAQVSEKHANFIINKGKARASDVEALIEKIQDTVYEQCHIKLETEVRIMGLAEH